MAPTDPTTLPGLFLFLTASLVAIFIAKTDDEAIAIVKRALEAQVKMRQKLGERFQDERNRFLRAVVATRPSLAPKIRFQEDAKPTASKSLHTMLAEDAKALRTLVANFATMEWQCTVDRVEREVSGNQITLDIYICNAVARPNATHTQQIGALVASLLTSRGFRVDRVGVRVHGNVIPVVAPMDPNIIH